jgi:probable non-F420 flavinoid oxidoreductase
MIIGYHASHEQFSPSELLDLVKAAEDVGFQGVMTSDHIAPWIGHQGNSGNNWAWLGAAMARTSLPFGSLAIPGGWRYHPVVVAHLIATLADMFPKRLRWIGVGSGEALNEHVVAKGWPQKEERNARLQTGSEIMRSLFRGEEVTVDHPWFQVDRAKLWSLPTEPPPLFGAALTNETAAWLGSWSDGLVTVRKPHDQLKELVMRFRSGGGEGKPLALQLQVAWAQSKEEARLTAWNEWRNAAAPPDRLADLAMPADFEKATERVEPDEMEEVIPLITRGEELLEIIDEVSSCGFHEVYIHSVSRDQRGFLTFMESQVLPFC